MPYVRRDQSGKVVGIFAARQPPVDGVETTDPLPLAEDDPEVLAYLAQHPIPEESLRARTPEEIESSSREVERIGREHEAIRANIERFNRLFAELELALSSFMQQILNIEGSQIGHAIYYSPQGFDARSSLVNNVVIQALIEDRIPTELSVPWEKIFNRIKKHRDLRNKIAHGMPLTLSIDNKQHARLSPLPFDVTRMQSVLQKKQIPGISAADIKEGNERLLKTYEILETFNRIVADHYTRSSTYQPRLSHLLSSL